MHKDCRSLTGCMNKGTNLLKAVSARMEILRAGSQERLRFLGRKCASSQEMLRFFWLFFYSLWFNTAHYQTYRIL